jgi:hypothetical protein
MDDVLARNAVRHFLPLTRQVAGPPQLLISPLLDVKRTVLITRMFTLTSTRLPQLHNRPRKPFPTDDFAAQFLFLLAVMLE